MTLTVIYQRLESLAVFAASVIFYFWLNYKWYWLFIFLLAPDITIASYAINKKAGAYIYNAGHSYMLPAILITVGIIANEDLLLGSSLVWFTHIAMDRTLGYGLKDISGFSHTHLGLIGRQKKPKKRAS